MWPIDSIRYPNLVLALGGNALILPGKAGTLEEQYDRISQAMAVTAAMLTAGHRAVITHGNGPVVGHLLLQMDTPRMSCRRSPCLSVMPIRKGVWDI